MTDSGFEPDQIDSFHDNGFVVARRLIPADLLERMLQVTCDHLERQIGSIEYEADLQYPGAPRSRDEDGGQTVRRLRQAISRDAVFTEYLMRPELTGRMKQLLESGIVVPLAHHNCVMTKAPRYSSATGWHQDIRYWSFQRSDLISAWLALGVECPENGCLQLIPGTHVMEFDRRRLDDELFLRSDRPENQALIGKCVDATLEPGDILFFHCRTFHSAGCNLSDRTKFSVVFTFRPASNAPLVGSRSASMPELLIPQV